MNTAQPIRSEQELKDFMNFYEQVQYHPRNQLLLTMGLNTALRISDLLSLQWKQVYDLENRSVREHLLLVEAKTGKASNIYLNEKITVQLQKYYRFLASGRSFEISGDAYLFCGKDADPISRVQAYRIIRKAAENSGLSGVISPHSLRKTFGYYAWKQGVPPVLLMEIYHHSSFDITKRYLGIEQDDRDEVFLQNLFIKERNFLPIKYLSNMHCDQCGSMIPEHKTEVTQYTMCYQYLKRMEYRF